MFNNKNLYIYVLSNLRIIVFCKLHRQKCEFTKLLYQLRILIRTQRTSKLHNAICVDLQIRTV